MRNVLLLAALVTVGGTAAAGQTKVATVRLRDSVRIIDERTMTPEGVRTLSDELKSLTERLRRLEEQLKREQRDRADGRLRAPNGDIIRTLSEIVSKQARLAVACAALRPVEGQSDGFLGIEISQIVMNEVRAGIEAPVERFARPPVIAMVKPGSPAAQAGLRAGDEWLAIERRDLVGSSVGDVMALVKPGVRVEIRIRRDGKDLELPVAVLRRPEYPAEACENDGARFFELTIPWQWEPPLGVQQVPMSALPRVQLPSIIFMSGDKAVLYGATFTVLTDDKRRALQVEGDGVLVDDVRQGSQADAAGLRAFDVVVRANGEPVKSLKDLLRVNGSDGLALSVVNRGETRTVKLVSR